MNNAMEYDILKSIIPIIDDFKYVKINKNNILNVLPYMKSNPEGPWLINDYLGVERYSEEETARFLLLYESINFCYWGKEKWKITFKDNEYSGSYGMAYAMARALSEGYNILDFEYLKNISREDFEEILRGSAVIPLFDERYEIVKEVASTVISKLNGDVLNLFEKATTDRELLKLIADNFDNFKDVSYYNEKPIYFFKRATMLTEDLFRNVKGIRDRVKNNKGLLACADYKIPQVLREQGILEYNEGLVNLVDNEIEIPHNSMMEIEIRASMIYVVELIKEELIKSNVNMTSIEIDEALWLLSKNRDQKNKPCHRTKSIYY